MGKIEQQRRYRQRHPEKVKEQKRKYYERKVIKKFKENPNLIITLEKKLYHQFVSLTRLLWKDKLPCFCESCGNTDSRELQIHHKQYKYPIERIDLLVLCKRCHIEEHQKIPTSPNDSERL